MTMTAEVVAGYSFLAGLCGGLGLACAWIIYRIAMKLWYETSAL